MTTSSGKNPANNCICFQSHPFSFDEQPISVKAAFVDIAYDYTKKRNVFRLKTYNGSEYLFQTDDPETMLSWIEAVQKNNNPDLDVCLFLKTFLIPRKSQAIFSNRLKVQRSLS